MVQHSRSLEARVETIRDTRGVEDLRDSWQEWQQTRDSNIDFFLGSAHSRGDACQPHVVVVHRNGRPDAALAGLKYRTKIPIKFGSVTVIEPALEIIDFASRSVLGNGSLENCRSLVTEVMNSLEDGEAKVAIWRQIDPNSPLYECSLKLPGVTQRDRCPLEEDHWSMDFPPSLAAFLNGLRRPQRSKLKRKYARMLDSRVEGVKIHAYRTMSGLDRAIEDMEQIASNSLKRQLGFGFLNTPRDREQLRMEAAQGWLRIYILYIGDKPVSFWKGTLYEKCLQADWVGFDLTSSALSPGILLLLYMIENSHQEVIDTIDFGTEHGHLHDFFGAKRRIERSVRVYAPKLDALSLNLTHSVARYITRTIQNWTWLDGVRAFIWKRRKAAALARIREGDRFATRMIREDVPSVGIPLDGGLL